MAAALPSPPFRYEIVVSASSKILRPLLLGFAGSVIFFLASHTLESSASNPRVPVTVHATPRRRHDYQPGSLDRISLRNNRQLATLSIADQVAPEAGSKYRANRMPTPAKPLGSRIGGSGKSICVNIFDIFLGQMRACQTELVPLETRDRPRFPIILFTKQHARLQLLPGNVCANHRPKLRREAFVTQHNYCHCSSDERYDEKRAHAMAPDLNFGDLSDHRLACPCAEFGSND